MRRTLLAALVLLSPLPAFAQVANLPVGARVRVESLVGYDLRKTTGTVMRVTGDSLVLATVALEQPIALSSLTSVQISRGRSRGTGARRGFFIAAGIVTGLALVATGSEGDPGSGAYVAIVALPIYGTVGALLGAAIGRERWETVPR